MKGTQHFSRMNYNVRRGLREIVAPSHKITKSEWAAILAEFDGTCAYCGAGPSAANRGILPDHLVAVTEFGELVPGNAVPACQSCNDSRGNGDWRIYLRSRFPTEATLRSARIEEHIKKHAYAPCTPESALTEDELAEYNAILSAWDALLGKAQQLQSAVARRRSLQVTSRSALTSREQGAEQERG
jgi:hypothetical protein